MADSTGTAKKIRVGFVVSRLDAGWIGGANYLSNLLQAVAALPDRQIETVLLVPPATDPAMLARFPADRVIATPLVAARDPRRLAAKAIERVIGRDMASEWLARRHGIDVLSHVPPLPRRGRSSSARAGTRRVAAISWIPDFQHEHLNDFFSPKELHRRRASDARMARDADIVLLSSLHAQRDLARFYPDATDRSRVLQFVSGLRTTAPVKSRAALAESYALDGPFLYLPNQFWIHKNHRVVIDALALLKARGCAATVVATGHTADYRHPDHFAALMAHAEAQGVGDMFRVLGMVPYDDVVALLHHAVAVINPSRFEGWSTTVEEAKSQGKPLLLSDIAVHREQAPDRGRFFGVDDPAALADLIADTLQRYSPDDEADAARTAAAALPQRVEAFARTYQAIVLDAAARTGRD